MSSDKFNVMRLAEKAGLCSGRFYESTRRFEGGMWTESIRDRMKPDRLPSTGDIIRELNRMHTALLVAQEALDNIENDDRQIPAPIWRSVLGARVVVEDALK